MIDAHTLCKILRGRWYGRYGTAPCPVCQKERRRTQNALTVSDGAAGLLVHCKKSNCGFCDILAAAGVLACEAQPLDPAIVARREAKDRSSRNDRIRQAMSLWRRSQPITGTPAESYLRGRGIACPLPTTLRFHEACWHTDTARYHPVLVALVQGGDGFAVHRTYLRRDGSDKATIEPARATLGPVGGGAVTLTKAESGLAVAEGIETALSLACGILRKPATILAALSTSGLRGLRLPDAPGRLTIASDGDNPGRTAADVLAERADALGWTVSILPAPDGRDWNDILRLSGRVK